MSYSVRSVTIGDLCREGGGSVQTGPFGSQLKASTYVPVGVPTVMPADLIDFRVSEQNVARIGPEDHLRMVRHHLEPGDIVYGRRGDIGRHALVTERERGWLCGTGCLRIRFGRASVDPQFVSYYLRQPSVIESILGKAVGTTMPNLNTSILESVTLELPPLAIQRRIAEILGRLDDKIEVNRRINRTLERMAQALYKHWFVDFGPFQDGEFVESEVGLVPRGWEVSTFDALVEIEVNVINPQSHPGEVFNHYSIPAYDEQGLPVAEPGAAVKSGKYLIQSRRVLVSKLNPATPRVWTVFDAKDRRSFTSTEFIHYICRSPSTWSFVNGYLRSQAFLDEFRAHVAGTTGSRQRVPPRVTMSFKLVKPPADVLRAFDELVGPYLVLIQRNLEEGQVLAAIRDYLLPRLLAGEVEV